MRALFTAILIAVTLTAVPALFAQEDGLDQYPYVAKVTGQDVYVRSGPGSAYYFTQKLSSPVEVIVVDKKYDWLKIIPPRESFSWISKRYVDRVQGNESIGIVTGDNVRVYAGSPNVSPRNSSSLQTKLSEGEHVRLTGEEMEDYYQIEPPATAYLWMSEQFLEYVGPVRQKPRPDARTQPAPKPQPVRAQPEPSAEVEPDDEPSVTEPAVPDVTTGETPVPTGPEQAAEEETEPQAAEQDEPAQADRPDADRMVFDLEQAINNEVLKPLEEQEYSEYRKQLNEIIKADESSRAVRYARFLLERIDRFELARLSQEELEDQQKQLEKIRERIQKQREELIAEIPDPGKYLVIGTLEESHIYTEQTGEKRYVIYDPDNRVLCYAVPAGDLENMNMEYYLGENVGLNGTASADEITPSTVVRFNKITVLE